MEKITHTETPTGIHVFDCQMLQIRMSPADGSDIGSKGGMRFQMFYKKQIDEDMIDHVQVDEFVVYPDAIDWEKGGRMKPEFEQRIKELTKKSEEDDASVPLRTQSPEEDTPKEEATQTVTVDDEE